MRIVDYQKKPIDLTELLIKFREKYRNVYMYQIGDDVFFYRPLSRAEYKTLFESGTVTDLDREDLIVSTCLLYPENFDMNNCAAGLITELAEQIMKNSFLTADAQTRILSYYRKDMADVDNQITCIIHEAFPTIDIEDMENWGVEQTLKYFSRAEWILHNIRGVPFQQGDKAHNAFINKPEPELPKPPLEYNLPKREPIQPETKDEPEGKTIEEPKPNGRKKKRRNHRGGKKEKLTPEKLAELKRKYPTIDWEHDDGNIGVEGLTSQPDVDTSLAPALRPRRKILAQKQATENYAQIMENAQRHNKYKD